MSDRLVENEFVIGLDLGGTKLASALFRMSGDGKLVFEKSLKNKRYEDIIKGKERNGLSSEGKCILIENAMAESIEELSAGLSSPPKAVGISSAGFIENGMVVEAWNTGMKNYPLRDKIASRSGIKTYLYKDSWAPVFGLQPEQPAMIFSIGTGFGGVSCITPLTIPLRSYTVRRRILWIPFLYCNDDPGYAVTFSEKMLEDMMRKGLEIAAAGNSEIEKDVVPKVNPAEFAVRLAKKAKEEKRLSPSRLELTLLKGYAPSSAGRMRPAEVYADMPGCATIPALLYEWITGEPKEPPELDALAAAGHPAALAAILMQSQFIGYILYRMQAERLDFALPPAGRIYATGSGYNKITHEFYSKPIAEAFAAFCNESKPPVDVSTISRVELIDVGTMPTTFACYGAATGAAEGLD